MLLIMMTVLLVLGGDKLYAHYSCFRVLVSGRGNFRRTSSDSAEVWVIMLAVYILEIVQGVSFLTIAPAMLEVALIYTYAGWDAQHLMDSCSNYKYGEGCLGAGSAKAPMQTLVAVQKCMTEQ